VKIKAVKAVKAVKAGSGLLRKKIKKEK